MNDKIIDYVSSKVVEDIRAARNLAPALCKAINQFPLIDHVRARIEPDDFPLIRSLIEDDSVARQNLGRALLRNIEDVKEVRDYVERMLQRDDLLFQT